MKTASRILSTVVVSALLLFSSCAETTLYSVKRDGIPSDRKATANPVLEETTNRVPNPHFSAAKNKVVHIELTGIQHPESKDWLRLYGTEQAQQNVWVEVDGVPKGILVENLASNNDTKAPLQLSADVIFLIDNSASMNQESDLVANEVSDWAKELSDGGLDIVFSCIGYDAYGINGAIEMTDIDGLTDFLNRPGLQGRDRSKGFPDSWHETLAEAYKTVNNYECGGKALEMADQYFDYRSGANRIYVNFTDEPNQPEGNADWSVDFVNDQTNWNTNQGTIHTVYSDLNITFAETPNWKEHPWKFSTYTGGTTMYAKPDFSDVSLSNLTVTGAMANSHRIQFKNTSDIADGAHTVKITIVSIDGKVKAEKEFTNVSFGD